MDYTIILKIMDALGSVLPVPDKVADWFKRVKENRKDVAWRDKLQKQNEYADLDIKATELQAKQLEVVKMQIKIYRDLGLSKPEIRERILSQKNITVLPAPKAKKKKSNK